MTTLCNKGAALAGPQVSQNQCGLQPLPSQITVLGEFRNDLASLGNESENKGSAPVKERNKRHLGAKSDLALL